MKPDVMEGIKHRVRSTKVKTVYNECDPVDGPLTRKHVENTKYRQAKKEQPAGGRRGNFADHIMSVENMLHTNPFVQLVLQAKEKVPCIILYTEEQLQDIRRFCCSSPHGQTTVLGFAKTWATSIGFGGFARFRWV